MADRLADRAGGGNNDAAPGKNVFYGAEFRSPEHVLGMGCTGFGLISEGARIDQDKTGKTEIFHDPCGKPHVPFVEGSNKHDVNLGHKKLLDGVNRCFQDSGTLVIDGVADDNRIGVL